MSDKITTTKKSSVTKLGLGLAFVLLGLIFVLVWRVALWTVIQGILPIVLILAGAALIYLSKS